MDFNESQNEKTQADKLKRKYNKYIIIIGKNILKKFHNLSIPYTIKSFVKYFKYPKIFVKIYFFSLSDISLFFMIFDEINYSIRTCIVTMHFLVIFEFCLHHFRQLLTELDAVNSTLIVNIYLKEK